MCSCIHACKGACTKLYLPHPNGMELKFHKKMPMILKCEFLRFELRSSYFYNKFLTMQPLSKPLTEVWPFMEFYSLIHLSSFSVYISSDLQDTCFKMYSNFVVSCVWSCHSSNALKDQASLLWGSTWTGQFCKLVK